MQKNITTPTDEHLLQACRTGDERAWARLVEKYQRLVYSIPLNYGLPNEDAADIAQIAFNALLQNLNNLADENKVGAWLATVARRHSWRVIQQKKRHAADQEIDNEAIGALLPDRNNPIARWELVEWLHDGLNLIGERCRELLVALYFDGEEPSYADIAQRLGIAEGSIGPTRGRCLGRLREMMVERS